MIRMAYCLLTFVFAASCAAVQPSPGPDENALVKLRAEKNSAEDHVLRAKQFPDALKQEKAKKLYEDATAQYNAYIDGLLHCIRTGKSADLTPSANQAAVGVAEFKKYVDDNSTTKGLDWFTTGANFIKTALDLYKSLKGFQEAARNKYADDLMPQIRWKKWIEIKE
jgi:hypothetical protein